MNALVKTAGTNMPGNQKREIIATVREALSAQFGKFDGESGNQLKANLSAFIADIEVAALKHSAKPPQAPAMFSSAVTTTLSDGSTITVLTPTRAATFVEWFTAAMDMPADTPVETVARLLKERGHIVSSTQIDEMKKRTDRKEKTGMRTDGWGNWFPRQDGDSVSIGNANRVHLRWYDNVFGLADGSRWDACNRVLLCNLVPSKLGL